jgi:large subunit ribosomal protein L25
MDGSILNVEARQLTHTKGELNRFRKNGKIPAVLFGKGMDSVPLFVNQNAFKQMLKHGKVFEIELGNTKFLVNAKKVQTNSVGSLYMHIDFHKLERNQSTTISVPVHTIGEAPGAKESGIVQVLMDSLEVTGKPKDMPEFIEVDISNVQLGENIHISDLKLSNGVTFAGDPETTVVSCTVVKIQVEEPVEAVVEEAAAEGSTPETTEESKTAENKEEHKKSA